MSKNQKRKLEEPYHENTKGGKHEKERKCLKLEITKGQKGRITKTLKKQEVSCPDRLLMTDY